MFAYKSLYHFKSFLKESIEFDFIKPFDKNPNYYYIR